MLKLLKDIIEAHGGVKRWNQFSKLEAEIVSGGKLLELNGIPDDSTPRQIKVWLRDQKASLYPTGGNGLKSGFSTSNIAIEKLDGILDGGYFNGCALWVYLTTPFFMLLPGIEVREIEPWQEGNETWNGLSVTFPSRMVTRSAVQNFYFGKDNLIRRNDYQTAISGDFYVAQYISALEDVQGILVPSKRRVYKIDADGKPLKDDLLLKIDLDKFIFS